MSLKEDIRRCSRSCGIAAIGFTSAEPFERDIARMEALEEEYRLSGRGHTPEANRQFRVRLVPRDFCPEARSILVAAEPIPPGNVTDRSLPGKPRGITATNYARVGRDWYGVLEQRLDRLAEFIRSRGHRVVETYRGRFRDRFSVRPRFSLLLRAAAVRAGLAQRGKNALVYTEEYGSFVVLAALYTDAEIPPDPPADPESPCGNCTACLDACPTGAIIRPYVLDAQRCMAVNDELKADAKHPVPVDRRSAQGVRTGGCDVCQAVCPLNRSLPPAQHALSEQLDPERLHPDLIASLSAKKWLSPTMILNLGNIADPAAVDALAGILRKPRADGPPNLRAYAAWALGRIDDPRAAAALTDQLASETEPLVAGEISAALGR